MYLITKSVKKWISVLFFKRLNFGRPITTNNQGTINASALNNLKLHNLYWHLRGIKTKEQTQLKHKCPKK